ncbi:MAG: hypothetical protein L3J01_01910 [Thiomicrorhabdus sp.]|nr:hypothetical protein [Thiomicrorhabdus sp.]
MSGYVLGHLLGRLVASYFLVWFLVFIGVSKLKWRIAFKHTHRWYGIVAVLLVFALGLSVAFNP